MLIWLHYRMQETKKKRNESNNQRTTMIERWRQRKRGTESLRNKKDQFEKITVEQWVRSEKRTSGGRTKEMSKNAKWTRKNKWKMANFSSAIFQVFSFFATLHALSTDSSFVDAVILTYFVLQFLVVHSVVSQFLCRFLFCIWFFFFLSFLSALSR